MASADVEGEGAQSEISVALWGLVHTVVSQVVAGQWYFILVTKGIIYVG